MCCVNTRIVLIVHVVLYFFQTFHGCFIVVNTTRDYLELIFFTFAFFVRAIMRLNSVNTVHNRCYADRNVVKTNGKFNKLKLS